MSVQVQLAGPSDSVPAQPDTGPCETCTIVISPGVYLSNLSSSDLFVAYGSSSGPADPVCIPSGKSKPQSWPWQKSQASGTRIALGLSRRDCAQAATFLHDSSAPPGSDIAAADTAAVQQHTDGVSTAKQQGVHLKGRAAATPSLADSFVSFLEGQPGKKCSKSAESQQHAQPLSADAGVIDIEQHQGKRTPFILQGTDGKVC